MLLVAIGAMLAGLLALVPTPASANGKDDLAEMAGEMVDWLEGVVEPTEQIAQLVADIERARTDPAALSGEQYADLFERITLIIPENAKVPPHVKVMVKGGAKAVGKLIGAATDNALQTIRYRFEKTMASHQASTALTPAEALWDSARAAANNRQEQLWAVLDWLSTHELGEPVPFFKIRRASFPAQLRSGAPNESLTLEYEGAPSFPVTLILRPRSCPIGGTCLTVEREHKQPEAENRITAHGAMWCTGARAAWTMDYEVLVRDARGVETAPAAVAVTCTPA
jgi:hypothetical protein